MGFSSRYFRRSASLVRQKRENSLSIILVSIVMVFFCCHSLKFFLVFYKVITFIVCWKT